MLLDWEIKFIVIAYPKVNVQEGGHKTLNKSK